VVINGPEGYYLEGSQFDTEIRLHSGIFDKYFLTVYRTYHKIALADIKRFNFKNREGKMVIYCLCCKKLVPVTEAYRVMKTGFYRKAIPLGMCTVCKTHGDRAVYAEETPTRSLVYKSAEAS